jgi:hypothetical protein
MPGGAGATSYGKCLLFFFHFLKKLYRNLFLIFPFLENLLFFILVYSTFFLYNFIQVV